MNTTILIAALVVQFLFHIMSIWHFSKKLNEYKVFLNDCQERLAGKLTKIGSYLD